MTGHNQIYGFFFPEILGSTKKSPKCDAIFDT